MQKSYLSITYDVSPRYVVNPLTGDRYFSGYEVKILPEDGGLPIPLGVFRNRRLARKKAHESIYRLREELCLNAGLDQHQNFIATIQHSDGLLAKLRVALNQVLQFLPTRTPLNPLEGKSSLQSDRSP